MRRRVGGALLAGVTALGVAALAGEGVAAAATNPTVSASAGTALTSLGTNPTAAGSAITLTVTGTVATTDTIEILLPCSTTTQFASASVTASSGTTAAAPTPVANGNCGTTDINEIPITFTAAPTSPTTITVTPTYKLTGAASGSVALSGQYVGSTSTTTFSVPSDLTVANVTVTPSAPLTVISAGTGDTAISNVSLTLPANGTVPTTDAVCLTLSAGTWDLIGGAPTVTQTNGSSNATITSAVVTKSGATTDSTIGFTQTNSTLNPPTFTLSGLHVDVPALTPNGVVTVTVEYAATVATCAPATNAIATSQTVFAVGSAPSAAIYGQTPQATAAAEFEKQFVSTAGSTATCTNNNNAVLATAADPYDALAAAYLEAQLGTGVLITPVSTSGAIDADTLAALKMAGVQRVYVVGGTLAVTQAEISTLQNTPAYNCGGLTTTGSNLTVYSGISGQTADDTAVAIDNYITGNGQGGVAPFALPSLSNAYSTASTYNQTTGNATTTAPSTVNCTAIVVADNDWRDATAAAGVAYAYHLPVILTPGGSLGSQASAELAKLGCDQVIALGGQLALQPAVVTSIQAMNVTVNGTNTPISVLRIAGQDYTQTAADLAMFEGTILGWTNTTVYAAQGAYWSDALAAGPLSGLNKSAILLTEGPTQGVGSYTDAVLKTAGTPPNGLGGGLTTGIQVLGGPLAVTAAQTSEMQSSLAAG